MSLVHVETPRERDGRAPGERTGNQRARVADHRGDGEPRDVAILDAPDVVEPIGEAGQPGPEHETGDRTLRPDPVPNRRRGCRGGLSAVGAMAASTHRSPRRSDAISSRALATIASRSAGGKNAL